MLLDVRCDCDRLDVFKVAEPGAFAPSEKLANGVIVSDSGVLVSNWHAKKFEEPFGGFGANVGDKSRHREWLVTCEAQVPISHAVRF